MKYFFLDLHLLMSQSRATGGFVYGSAPRRLRTMTFSNSPNSAFPPLPPHPHKRRVE